MKSGNKKVYNWVSSNEVDEPRAYYTEWSKSERETQIPYDTAYIWNLKHVANNVIHEQKQTHQQRKQTYGSQKEKGVGRNKLAIEN